MKRICVYCGSSPGAKPEYAEAARRLGKVLAERRLGLVYGGASVGIMGAVADAALQGGAEVVGVIPERFAGKVGHARLTELHVVDSMHERKALMMDLSDAFIALPGGIGTMEELFEVLAWAQLGLHRKPCGLLNTCNYYQKLIEFLDHSVAERFVKAKHRAMVHVAEDPEALLDSFAEYRAPRVEKWIDRK